MRFCNGVEEIKMNYTKNILRTERKKEQPPKFKRCRFDQRAIFLLTV